MRSGATYPIATAHVIGARTKQGTSLPSIADFRDPMIDDGFPSAPAQRRSFERIEARAVEDADRPVLVTLSAKVTRPSILLRLVRSSW